MICATDLINGAADLMVCALWYIVSVDDGGGLVDFSLQLNARHRNTYD